MGIPKFASWLRKAQKYNRVVISSLPDNATHLYIDANGILHKSAQQVYHYGEHGDSASREDFFRGKTKSFLEGLFHAKIQENLMQVIRTVQPTETVIIAVDGSAPAAKIQQQRQRRFRASFEGPQKKEKAFVRRLMFDSNSLTPGTKIMRDIDTNIRNFIRDRRQELPPKVIYSSHLSPGEGEHKIMDYIRGGETANYGSRVLYGADADLIMLGVIAPTRYMYIVRDDFSDIVHIENLKHALRESMLGKGSCPKNDLYLRDFVVMSMLIGNDFLPHVVGFEHLNRVFEEMLQIYRRFGGNLVTTDGDIHWNNLSAFLKLVQEREISFLEGQVDRDIPYPNTILVNDKVLQYKLERDRFNPSRTIRKPQINYPLFRSLWYINVFGPKIGKNVSLLDTVPAIRKYLPDYNLSIDVDCIINMVYEYFRGMGWMYRYYTKGSMEVDLDWYYPYHHAPLLTDLSTFNMRSRKNRIEGYERKRNQLPHNVVYQLLAVLPKSSKNLIPKEFQILQTPQSRIGYLYPQDGIIERLGVHADYMGVLLIPFADMQLITRVAQENVSIPGKRRTLFDSVDDLIDTRPKSQREYDRIRGLRKRRGIRKAFEEADRESRCG